MNDKKYILIKWEFDYADEFDVPYFWVTSVEKYNAFRKLLSNNEIDADYEFYFGTNEWINLDSGVLLDTAKFYLLTKSEYETFYKIFGTTWSKNTDSEFGLLNIVNRVCEYFDNIEISEESKQLINLIYN